MRINFFSAGIIYLAIICLVLIIGCKSFQTAYFGVEDEAITAPKEFTQTRFIIESAKESADSPYAEKKINEAMALGEQAAIAYWKCFDEPAKNLLALAQQSAYRAELFHPQPPPPVAARANATPVNAKLANTTRANATPANSKPANSKPGILLSPETVEADDLFAGVVALPPRMILETVFFGYDSDTISPYDQFLLNGQVPVLKDHSDFVFEIAGHSDASGSDPYNQILSQRRAESVIHYLTDSGISHNQLYPIGYGEADPFYSNDTETGQAKNRRAEIRVTGSLLPEIALKNLDTLPAGTTLEIIHFNHSDLNILPVYQALLDKAVPLIKGSPDVRLEIAGHTDNIGSNQKNLELSLKRANIVKEYLVARGVFRNRLTTTVYASAQPLSSNLTSIGKNLNRRVEIKVFE